MPTNFLSEEQRRRFGHFTEDPDEGQLAGSFLLDQTARCRAMAARGARNRIGWAVQGRRSPAPPWQSHSRLVRSFDSCAGSLFRSCWDPHPAAVASGLALGAAAVAATRGRRAREYLVRRTA
ncbi:MULTISPECIES: DUF4158 domain-containing protein [unclassified Streptomyces]|uniref:DUF4158 domain-containing protein n=1 Tax=unclassified Streptomyces TaxID=2593676 RepID=UPI00366764C1